MFRVSNINKIEYENQQENLEVKLTLKKQIWVSTSSLSKLSEFEGLANQLSPIFPQAIKKRHNIRKGESELLA